MNNRLEPYFQRMEQQQDIGHDTEIQDGGSYLQDALVYGFCGVCLFVVWLLGRLIVNL